MNEGFVNILLNLFPNFLYLLKRRIVLYMLKSHGSNIRGLRHTIIDGYSSIEIGDNFFSAEGLHLSSTKGIIIGNNVTLGPEVMIIGGNHKTNVIGKKINEVNTGDKLLSVIIEDDVWLGARVTVLTGVTIGEGAVIGAGSVVTRSIPPYCISVGNPCRPIKMRFNSINDLEHHLSVVKSRYSLEIIKQEYDKHGVKYEF